MSTEKTKKRLSKKAKTVISVLCAVFVLLAAELIYSNYYIEAESFEYSAESVPPAFDGVKIVSVTDYHNHGGFYEDDLIHKIEKVSPDYIFLVGDIVDSTFTDINVVSRFFKRCSAIAPCYLCFGNHEQRVFGEGLYDSYMTCAEDAGVTVLDNKAVTLERGNDKLTLIGTSNPLEQNMLSEILEGADKQTPLLWIHHYPEDFADMTADAESLGFQKCLMFCGHAHGGLIRMPFTNQGIYAPGQGLFPKFTGGEYYSNNSEMILSRGCGNSGATLRMFDPFEIVVCTLGSEKS